MFLDEIIKEIFSEADFVKPSYAGVYFVCARNQDSDGLPIGKERIIYIGSSKNISKRLACKNHPYLLAYRRFTNKSVITRSYHTENYLEMERAFIERFKPLLNKQHK